MTRNEACSIQVHERDECFIAAGLASEDAFRLQRLQIESIKERQVALRRRAVAGEKNPIAALLDDALAGCDQTCQRRTRIVVSLLRAQAPDLPRRRVRRFIHITKES